MKPLFNYSPEKAEEVLLLEELSDESFHLIIFNDDVNTFDHVIECLVRICKHDPIQAEQCAMIIHHKGKCSVKSGSSQKLSPLCTALCDEGLSAVIE